MTRDQIRNHIARRIEKSLFSIQRGYELGLNDNPEVARLNALLDRVLAAKTIEEAHCIAGHNDRAA
jgi:hypothetical protein